MIHPQDVTYKPSENAIFMVFGLKEGKEAEVAIPPFCDTLGGIIRSMRNRFPHLNLLCVFGIGSEAWGRCFPKRNKPKELQVFQEIKGDKHTAPSTPGDLFFHLSADRADVVYETAGLITNALGKAVRPIDETHGFRYFDGRSILGFADGTENPVGEEAAKFATIGEEDPEFCGGSYAFIQKYIHDIRAWEKLTTEEQENVIGRRKFTDIELSDEEKPKNAHNALTNIEDEAGGELKIFRANTPFANPSKHEYGTYFVGYASDFNTTRRMLENMFIGDPPGNTDRILDFSRAVTGTLFFVPPLPMLEDLAK